MKNRKAFTLIEVLISISLLGLIIVPLFSVVEMMRNSNNHLLKALENSKQVSKASKILFLDILGSDGRLEIKKDEFTRLCIDETKNSLYNLPVAKVCWVVLKNKNTLVRVEGNAYKMPLKSDDRIEVDAVMNDIKLFDVYHEKDKVVVLIKQQSKEPISFMVQGIVNPVSKVLADGTQIFKDGSKILPDGTIVAAPNKNKSKSKNTLSPNQGKRP